MNKKSVLRSEINNALSETPLKMQLIQNKQSVENANRNVQWTSDADRVNSDRQSLFLSKILHASLDSSATADGKDVIGQTGSSAI